MTESVEVLRIGRDGLWALHDMSDADALLLASVDVRISMHARFDGIGPAAV